MPAPQDHGMPDDDTPTRPNDPEDFKTRVGVAQGRRVFARYTLKQIIGRGGMGVVWEAQDAVLDEPVALKFLPDEVARDAVAVDELIAETRHAHRLTHPNIVRVHDFLRDENLAAVSMEFVSGTTLAQLRLSQPGKVFSVETLAPIVEQLCAALDYAHTTAEVVHRDLKPANVLITASGRAKIADFGIARSLMESATRLTGKGGDTSGTLPYMSPQQVLGRKPAVSDDIYALGAMLYELLTGKPPFFRGDPYSLMKQIAEVTPQPLTERRAELGITGGEIPARWQETILACLAKEPAHRPASIRELGARLGGTMAPVENPRRDDIPPGRSSIPVLPIRPVSAAGSASREALAELPRAGRSPGAAAGPSGASMAVPVSLPGGGTDQISSRPGRGKVLTARTLIGLTLLWAVFFGLFPFVGYRFGYSIGMELVFMLAASLVAALATRIAWQRKANPAVR